MFPGPPLSLRRGEHIKVNIHNRGTYGVTIHCIVYMWYVLGVVTATHL
ncbi:hypothetical protein V2J09_003947 [Rumex salicifolius]